MRPDGLEQRAHLLDLLGPRADAVHEQRLAHDLADRHARIERGVGVLEDRLHVAAEAEQFGLRGVRHVRAFEEHAARGRLFQPHDGAAERRLPAAGFAHKAERLAFLHVEADAVDRAHVADLGREHAAAHGIVFLQSLDDEKRSSRSRSLLGVLKRVMAGDEAVS